MVNQVRGDFVILHLWSLQLIFIYIQYLRKRCCYPWAFEMSFGFFTAAEKKLQINGTAQELLSTIASFILYSSLDLLAWK